MVSASDDKTLKIWELASRRVVATLQGHTDGVRACAVTPDGRHVVSASDDRTLKIWELTSRRAVATLQGHTDGVRACAVTPDGRHVVSASEDHVLKVWDLATHTCRVTHRGDAPYLAVAASTTTVIAGDAAGNIWFFDMPRSLASFIDTPSAPEPPVTHTIWSIAAPDVEPSPKARTFLRTRPVELASAASGGVDTSHATSETDLAQAKHDRHAGSPATEKIGMTREELLSRLSKLLPPQFEQVLYLARIPQEHLPAVTAAQALRAVELMRYAEQQRQLDQLARIVQQVAGPGPR